jgi:hypothetical protein
MVSRTSTISGTSKRPEVPASGGGAGSSGAPSRGLAPGRARCAVARDRPVEARGGRGSAHFGPDEAERLVFSRAFCFTEATHELGGQTASGAEPESPAGGAVR